MSVAPPQPRKRGHLAVVEQSAPLSTASRARATAIAAAAPDARPRLSPAPLLLVLAVPLLLIAIAIRIDSGGPALFRQQRVGRGPARLHDAQVPDDVPRRRRDAPPRVRPLADRGDRRATAATSTSSPSMTGSPASARSCARWSLDELPQLINVLFGQMALVGPRPVIPYEVEMYPRRVPAPVQGEARPDRPLAGQRAQRADL